MKRWKRLVANGWTCHAIARLDGVTVAQVRAAVSQKVVERDTLHAERMRQIKQVPPGRTAAEHYRIVCAVFGNG